MLQVAVPLGEGVRAVRLLVTVAVAEEDGRSRQKGFGLLFRPQRLAVRWWMLMGRWHTVSSTVRLRAAARVERNSSAGGREDAVMVAW